LTKKKVFWSLKAVQVMKGLRPNLKGPETKGALLFLTPQQRAFQCYFLCLTL